ncbi:MAG: hypothetical protein KF729_25395 [Sandaracinaceae bacterium]|nr:hypothetical protein [Sandaracinaceae bacterium]
MTNENPTAPIEDRSSGMLDLHALAARARAERPARSSFDELYLPSWPVVLFEPPRRAPSRAVWIERAAIALAALAISLVVTTLVAYALVGRAAPDAPLAPPAAEGVGEPSASGHPAAPGVSVADVADVAGITDVPGLAAVAGGPLAASGSAELARADVREPASLGPAPRAARVPPPARSTDGASARVGASREVADPGLGGELDRLLDAALADRRAPVVAGPSLPLVPSQRDVSSVLRALEARIARCGDGEGTATARLVIDGATGRPRSVTVGGVPAPVAECVREAVETAAFPVFTQPTLTVAFPYRV